LLVSGTYAISLWGISVALGGNPMISGSEAASEMLLFAKIFGVLTLIIFGFMVGIFIDICRAGKKKHKIDIEHKSGIEPIAIKSTEPDLTLSIKLDSADIFKMNEEQRNELRYLLDKIDDMKKGNDNAEKES